jgi:hypothetical protein
MWMKDDILAGSDYDGGGLIVNVLVSGSRRGLIVNVLVSGSRNEVTWKVRVGLSEGTIEGMSDG